MNAFGQSNQVESDCQTASARRIQIIDCFAHFTYIMPFLPLRIVNSVT